MGSRATLTEDVTESLRASVPVGRDVWAEGHFSLVSMGMGSLCIEGAPEMGESGSSRDFTAEQGGKGEEGIEERAGVHTKRRRRTYSHMFTHIHEATTHTHMHTQIRIRTYIYVHNTYLCIMIRI